MKKTFSKILAGISVLFSVIFGVGSAFVLVDNVLGGTNVNAQNEESDIHSVTDITVDNVNEKIEEIKNIDSEDLEYNQELTEICEDDAFFEDDGSVYIYDENWNLYSTPNIGEFDNVNLTNIVIEEAKKEALGKYVLKGDFDSTNDLVATNAVLTKKDNQF